MLFTSEYFCSVDVCFCPILICRFEKFFGETELQYCFKKWRVLYFSNVVCLKTVVECLQAVDKNVRKESSFFKAIPKL